MLIIPDTFLFFEFGLTELNTPVCLSLGTRPFYCWWCGSNSFNFLSRRREIGVAE